MSRKKLPCLGEILTRRFSPEFPLSEKQSRLTPQLGQARPSGRVQVSQCSPEPTPTTPAALVVALCATTNPLVRSFLLRKIVAPLGATLWGSLPTANSLLANTGVVGLCRALRLAPPTFFPTFLSVSLRAECANGACYRGRSGEFIAIWNDTGMLLIVPFRRHISSLARKYTSPGCLGYLDTPHQKCPLTFPR